MVPIKKLGFLRNFKREPEPSKIRQSRIGLGHGSDPSLLVNTQNDESLSFGCKDNDGRYGLISHSLITPGHVANVTREFYEIFCKIVGKN